MKTNIYEIPIRAYGVIPRGWKKNVANYPESKPDVLYKDGWRNIVEPTINTETQKRGELIYDAQNDVVTYQVIDLSLSEIEARQKASVPFSITPTQGRIRLVQMDLMNTIKTLVEDSTDEEMKIYWEYALSWDRDNSYIQAIASAVGMSEEDLDTFFIEASQIN